MNTGLFHHPLCKGRSAWLCAFVISLSTFSPAIHTLAADELEIPQIGDHKLVILSPTLLELVRINTKQQGSARISDWDWVNDQGTLALPNLSSVRVTVNGQPNPVTGTGFKRRPVYAPFAAWDLRVANHLYLKLANPVLPGQAVQVVNDGSVWPTNLPFAAVAHPLRNSPAIHVNQEGYMPALPKKAMVGYYLGSLGEMPLTATAFTVVNAQTGATAHQGMLTLRPDVGYLYTPTPYQIVYEADFTALTAPGEYRLVVPGLGASLPFRITDGIGLNFARAYALGLFHQRSGFAVGLPFTRFVHGADHTAPAVVPVHASSPFGFTWTTISNYAITVNSDNPPQTAPRLTSPAAQLYPFVNPGPVDVSGGHFEAGNYSKPAWNSAHIIHSLMFAVDTLPGVAALDNMGLPESGDGISDVLQEAKWEADCLAKMQDTDGGFYYMIHPRDREYEYDVLPENGDLQVVWPKNTASTAAAVAALAQCASSPAFRQAYPQAVSLYRTRAQRGWQFLTNAIAAHGKAGAYQRIMHFDDAFTHDDDLAWAACELYLDTGDSRFRTQLEAWLPDPAAQGTIRWGWQRMYASYGNVIRSYAAAARSGRLQNSQLNPVYLARCVEAITSAGNDTLRWSQENAYGTSFPDPTKRIRDAGWYFSTDQAFNLVVAQQFSPNPAFVDAIVRNVNYEAGCNPVNVSYLTGIGWRRQYEIVDQYSLNDHSKLPKIGIPISNIQVGFVYTWTYGDQLAMLVFPSDGSTDAPYPFYDRWGDFWNVTTEASTSSTVRNFVTCLWLATQSPSASTPWKSTAATITVPPGTRPIGEPLTVQLNVGGNADLADARIIWEARNQPPAFGASAFSFVPIHNDGPHWIEAEVHWPDGRRAFATNAVNVTLAPRDPPKLTDPRYTPNRGFTFVLVGMPYTTCVVESSANLFNWTPFATNTLPWTGTQLILHQGGPRFYRARKLL